MWKIVTKIFLYLITLPLLMSVHCETQHWKVVNKKWLISSKYFTSDFVTMKILFKKWQKCINVCALNIDIKMCLFPIFHLNYMENINFYVYNFINQQLVNESWTPIHKLERNWTYKKRYLLTLLDSKFLRLKFNVNRYYPIKILI